MLQLHFVPICFKEKAQQAAVCGVNSPEEDALNDLPGVGLLLRRLLLLLRVLHSRLNLCNLAGSSCAITAHLHKHIIHQSTFGLIIIIIRAVTVAMTTALVDCPRH